MKILIRYFKNISFLGFSLTKTHSSFRFDMLGFLKDTNNSIVYLKVIKKNLVKMKLKKMDSI